MKPTFSIFVAVTLLLASNSAEAARGAAAGNRNVVIAPIPQISTAPPQANPIGGLNQSFGVVPGFSETNPVGPGLWCFAGWAGIAYLQSQCRAAIAE